MGFGDNYHFQMSIAYGIVIFIVMTTLISDFSSVLLDVRDRSILSTKPINAKTINAAKILHILIYLTYLTIALTAIPLLVSLFTQGILFFLLTVFALIFINIFIVVLTTILYIVILRFFDGEKLKDIINYVQIGLSLVLMMVIKCSFDPLSLSTLKWS
ncbi:ABC transporter permease OS=Lysinibacillus sphaericus OX=1421 GN=LS41612_12845 PE=4 SV=1 [Lysinibacillus sphaericus]